MYIYIYIYIYLYIRYIYILYIYVFPSCFYLVIVTNRKRNPIVNMF